MVAAERWIEHMRPQCVSVSGDLRFTAVRSDVDKGCVHVMVSGNGIFAKEEM